MSKILTLPTWQIFILLMTAWGSLSFGFIVGFIFAAVLTYCIYFLAANLYKKLPTGHDLKIKVFNFHLFSILSCLTFVFILMDEYFDYFTNPQTHYAKDWTIFVFAPIEFFIVYSILYVYWFIAKAIATIENQKRVRFNNYSRDFFLLWFPPIGIWWVYPKVRRIFSVD